MAEWERGTGPGSGPGAEDWRREEKGEGVTGKARELKDEASAKAHELKDEASAKAHELKDSATDRIEDAAAKARDRGGELAHEGRERAVAAADNQKDRVSQGLRTVADALRRGGRDLPEDRRQYGRFLNAMADRAERASRYLEARDADMLTREAQDFARNHTAAVLGGAFVLGVAGARFLKSSGSRGRDDMWSERVSRGYDEGYARNYGDDRGSRGLYAAGDMTTRGYESGGRERTARDSILGEYGGRRGAQPGSTSPTSGSSRSPGSQGGDAGRRPGGEGGHA